MKKIKNKLNTRMLLSGTMIVAAVAIVVGAAFAFFSDTETSTGNVLAAGAIDLQIDNESYVTDVNGVLVASPNTSWELADLNDENGPVNGAYLFFNFDDLKPGDLGEDTISLHVSNNDAYLCAAARITEDSDVDYTEPELEDDSSVDENDPLASPGELGENLNFVFWGDDGDNVLETDEVDNIFIQGPVSALGEQGKIALADSDNNVWGNAGPVLASTEVYVGKAWCFGNLTQNPVAPGDNNPLQNSGFTCSGDPDENNAAQTDRVVGDFQFYAVQSRNNSDFTCAEDYNPTWPDSEVQAAPVVDGIISPGEYDGALSMEITNTGGGTVKAKTQGGFLYLAADILTDTTDNRVIPGFNDEFGINLGESPATDTVFLGLGSTNANGRTVGTIDSYYTNFVTTGHSLVALFGTGHRVIEWKIPLSVIPSIITGDTLSIGGATESTDGNSAVYPVGLVWGSNPTYGQLVVSP